MSKDETGCYASRDAEKYNDAEFAALNSCVGANRVKPFRIALANIRFPANPDESISLAIQAIDEAAKQEGGIVCFPECYVPGYRGEGKNIPPPDQKWLETGWARIGDAARRVQAAVVLGTERIVNGSLTATALVINADGSIVGFQ